MTLIATVIAFGLGTVFGAAWCASRTSDDQCTDWKLVVEEALERAVKAEQRERATKERALIVLAAAEAANTTAKEAIAQRDAARATLRLERDVRGQQ